MRNVLIITNLFLGFSLFAQSTFQCGTNELALHQIEERLLAHQKHLQNGRIESRSDLSYLPITFHLIATDEGFGRVKESDVLDQLCQINTDFISYNIQFFLKKLNYIDNTALYNEHVEQEEQLKNERDNGSLNIFIVNDANNNSSLEDGTTFGYFDSSKDWLVMRKDQINGKSIVLTHEVGHFLGLLHPYNGWDFEPWDANIHGNPAPSRTPEGIATERMDGSNCKQSGDFLCDTPPDYFFAFRWDNCNYTGGALDPDGVLVDPDELNYMANYLDDCPRDAYFFSEEQTKIMLSDIDSPKRNYLRNDFDPKPINSISAPILEFPSKDGNVSTFNLVSLKWSDVEGVTQYLVEIDRVRSFNIQTRRIVTDNNFLEVNDLEAQKQYYWRVRPFTAYSTCTEFSEPSNFRTGSNLDTTQLELIDKMSLYPNPLGYQQVLTLQLETQRTFKASIYIYDVLGKLLYNQIETFSPASTDYSVDFQRFATGLYTLVIITDEGQMERKFIVTDE